MVKMKKIIKLMCMTLFILFAFSQKAEAADYEFNNVEIGKEYTINSLTAEWGYILQTEIPEDGRIRIWINDYTSDIYRDHLYISGEGSAEWDDIESWEHREWVKSTESMNSGWITVNKGQYYSRFYADGASNREANVYIEFESNTAYYGEKEGNDTFDEATEIILGERYEGNYSKADDEDYYKFVLEAPGLIEISSTNTREGELMRYRIYEEDENLNVYEIYYNYNISESSHDVADRLRLPAGTYYMYVAHMWMDPEYTIKVKYTAESSEQFEQEYNNISKNANEILPREKYTGNLNTIEDVDYYKFYVPRKSYVTLCSWIPRQIGDKLLSITLYDEGLNKKTSLITSENAYKESKKVLVEKGYYFICVRDCDEYVYGSPDTLDNLYDYSVKADVKCYQHVYETEILQAATTQKDGTKKYTCKVCGDTKTEKISAISSMTLSTTTYTYTGGKKTPSVTVKDIKGTKLENGTDYKLTYSSSARTSIGRYSVKVTFMGKYSGSKTLYYTIGPKNPTSVKATLYGHDDVKVTWSKVSGASGYRVYYKKATSSTWSSKTTTGTSMKLANLADGVKYDIKVVTYKIIGGYKCYNAGKSTSIYTLKKITGMKAKKSGSKVKVSWTNIAGETGYQISQSTKKNGTKIVATYRTSSGKYKTVSATKGKTYYYKVRAYKEVNGKKIYSPWSTVVKYVRK